jgi:hypothetical protein
MRMTRAAMDYLHARLQDQPESDPSLVLGLVSSSGISVEDDDGRSATLHDRILGICRWTTEQAAGMRRVTILGVGLVVHERTFAELEACLIDYMEWIDLATGLSQPYLQLRDG